MLDSLRRRFFYAGGSIPKSESASNGASESEDEDVRPIVIATVAELKDVPEETITDQTLLGSDADLVCTLLCTEFGRAIFVDDDTTVGELITQLEEP